MHAVRVLFRIDQVDDGVFVNAFRQRQLHDVAGAGGVGVQFIHRRRNLIEGGIRRQFALDGRHADLGAVGMLAGDVFDRTRVGTDQNGP